MKSLLRLLNGSKGRLSKRHIRADVENAIAKVVKSGNHKVIDTQYCDNF